MKFKFMHIHMYIIKQKVRILQDIYKLKILEREIIRIHM